MEITVIICTIGRPSVLNETVLSLLRQSLPPTTILIATPSKTNVLDSTLNVANVRLVTTGLGLPTQRNEALKHLPPSTDLIAFIDDDIELCVSYFKAMAEAFISDSSLIIASGKLLHDGGISTPISRTEAVRLCKLHECSSMRIGVRTEERRFGYGCNLFANARIVKDERFDEKLPLYAWLEDSDYSFRCTKGKRAPVTCLNAVAVHLGWQGGRVSGYRLGFSQMVNPIYLWKKCRVFSFTYLVRQFWLRCLLGNLLGTLTLNTKEDRFGRLRGNILGLRHLASGRCDPSLATRLEA